MEISPELFEALHLTEAQSRVYLVALELGHANMQSLSRKSGVKRSTIYTFIEEMKRRGFITETKKNHRKFYGAVHPAQLVEASKAKVAELERALPELLAFYDHPGTKPRVAFYEGIEGIKEVYADMLKENKEIIAYEDLEHMKIGLPQSFYEYFPPERARRGIPFRSISRDSETARDFIKDNKNLLRETKFIHCEDLRTEINIYGSKVALMSFRTDPQFCVLIENQDIAQTMRVAWQTLWERLDSPV